MKSCLIWIIGYYNTTIVLSERDATWGLQPNMHNLACADYIRTPDGGKTWEIGTISIQESNAPADFGKTAKPGGPALCSSKKRKRKVMKV
jgi:hypothetical protein